MKEILNDILKEHNKTIEKWGVQDHKPHEWCLILNEEVGEINKEALEMYFTKYYEHDELRVTRYKKELLQTASVILSMLQGVYNDTKN